MLLSVICKISAVFRRIFERNQSSIFSDPQFYRSAKKHNHEKDYKL